MCNHHLFPGFPQTPWTPAGASSSDPSFSAFARKQRTRRNHMTGGCADGGLLDAAMISCSSDYRVLNGGFATLASFDDSHTYGEMTGGIAELLVHPAGIVTHLVVRGPAGQNFSAHLHAAPCASNGGPHYQDPTAQGNSVNVYTAYYTFGPPPHTFVVWLTKETMRAFAHTLLHRWRRPNRGLLRPRLDDVRLN